MATCSLADMYQRFSGNSLRKRSESPFRRFVLVCWPPILSILLLITAFVGPLDSEGEGSTTFRNILNYLPNDRV